MCSYRVLFGAGLALWLLMTLFLAIEPVNLVTVRFSSGFAFLWFTAGVGLLVLLLLGIGRRPRRSWTSQYTAISAYLNEGIVICSPKGRVQWYNDAGSELVADGKTLPESARALLERARMSGRVAIQTIPVREGVRLSVQAFPLNRSTFALVCRPLSSDNSRSTFYENFIRRIVHDMRNPLAAIIGHAANISQSPGVEPEAWRKSATTIESEAQRLARLVDSMLFDARLAYVPLEPAMLDLVDVIEEAVYAREEIAQRENKSLEIEAPPDTMRAEGDRDLLVRAFENLIDNSLKYSDAGAQVRVRLEDQTSNYAIYFIDNGIGIPPEYLPDRIFEPLVRARSHQTGSGLGLSIAKKIFEMHGGGIVAQSKLGQGTTMTVRLPKPSEVGK
jgi:signal transduction histidine kinase